MGASNLRVDDLKSVHFTMPASDWAEEIADMGLSPELMVGCSLIPACGSCIKGGSGTVAA